MFDFLKLPKIKATFDVAIIMGLIFGCAWLFTSAGQFWDTVTGNTKVEMAKDNARLENNQTVLVETIEKNKDSNTLEVGNIKDNQDAVVEVVKHKQDSNKKTDNIVQKKDKVIDKVERNPVLTDQQKDLQKAEAQIDMLWENFCRIDKSCEGASNA